MKGEGEKDEKTRQEEFILVCRTLHSCMGL